MNRHARYAVALAVLLGLLTLATASHVHAPLQAQVHVDCALCAGGQPLAAAPAPLLPARALPGPAPEPALLPAPPALPSAQPSIRGPPAHLPA